MIEFEKIGLYALKVHTFGYNVGGSEKISVFDFSEQKNIQKTGNEAYTNPASNAIQTKTEANELFLFIDLLIFILVFFVSLHKRTP